MYRRLAWRLAQLQMLVKNRKPRGLSWRGHLRILSSPIRYQPLLFPDGSVVEKKCVAGIIDSREKLEYLGLPDRLDGQTVLDIGCAEGFFVRESVRRGASFARGCDVNEDRLLIARDVAGAWGFGQSTEFHRCELNKIPDEWAADITICLAVGHHQHGGNHDTWEIICDTAKDPPAFQNMLKAVRKVASLTKHTTFWEYSYEYAGPKPGNVNHALLGQIWEEHNIYSKVDFKGLSMSTETKDRAIYHAFK